jgi:hypothetical protein
MLIWKKEVIHAKIISKIPPTLPHWWKALPQTKSLPLIEFEVKDEWNLPDNLFTGTIFDLYSNKLINIINNSKVQFEIFSTKIKNHRKENDYKIFHLLEKYSCINRELSDIDYHTLKIRKLVLKESFLRRDKKMFRIRTLEHIVLISDDLKNKLQENKITGCEYIPLENFIHSGTELSI